MSLTHAEMSVEHAFMHAYTSFLSLRGNPKRKVYYVQSYSGGFDISEKILGDPKRTYLES